MLASNLLPSPDRSKNSSLAKSALSYRVIYDHPRIQKRFEKELAKVPSLVSGQIKKSVLAFAQEPRPRGVIKIKPPLDIFHCLAQYRIAVGNYRVFYDIDEGKKQVSIIALRRRNEKTYLGL